VEEPPTKAIDAVEAAHTLRSAHGGRNCPEFSASRSAAKDAFGDGKQAENLTL
jgi:hypothetical protein